MNWTGVMPAITTQFKEDGSVDLESMARHAQWMIREGCAGIVALGSLGEGGTLDFDEKRCVLESLVKAVGPATPVVAGISALSTTQAVKIAQEADRLGCRGLMVLPPYAYRGDWREQRAHYQAVFAATNLSCMLYNNPIAYQVDVLPEQLQEIAEESTNLHAVKESSADVRRITAIRHLLGSRLAIFVGVDDLAVEAVAAGATGWVAGLANAFPNESVRLFELSKEAKHNEADRLYRWFLPLLRMDVVPEFVQLIKLVQQEVGFGSERVRSPRIPLTGEAREQALATIRASLESPCD